MNNLLNNTTQTTTESEYETSDDEDLSNTNDLFYELKEYKCKYEKCRKDNIILYKQLKYYYTQLRSINKPKYQKIKIYENKIKNRNITKSIKCIRKLKPNTTKQLIKKYYNKYMKDKNRVIIKNIEFQNPNINKGFNGLMLISKDFYYQKIIKENNDTLLIKLITF